MSVARCLPSSVSFPPLTVTLSLTLALVGLALGATQSLAGPHAHGALIVHWNEQLVYTDGGDDYCGQSALSACDFAVTRTDPGDGSEAAVLTILAAFPGGSLPELRGATFGIQYDPELSVLDWGACGDFVLPTSGWPGSGEGVALTWNIAQTSWLVECAWFAVSDESLLAASFDVIAHPTQGGKFADDSVPSQLDEVEFYGSFGFLQDGSAPCPPPVEGACCQPLGSCQMLLPDACADAGGIYAGVGTVCDPNPCPQPEGACCRPNGSCFEVEESVCVDAGFIWNGAFTSCIPNPCPPATGACCREDGSCFVVLEEECVQAGFLWRGPLTDCAPNPCPPPTGACCFLDGNCSVMEEMECALSSGIWNGIDSPCAPNPCPQPIGACCLGSGDCAVLIHSECLEAAGTFLGADTVCAPESCPAGGACCFPSGECEVRTAAYCAEDGGSFLGEATVCDPNPCPDPCNARGVAEGASGRILPRPSDSELLFGDSRRSMSGDDGAGPNAGGVLLLHSNPGISYTSDVENYCGQSGEPGCDVAVTSSSSAEPTVIHVLAAFHPASFPRMSAVEFGIDYGFCLSILAWGSCADFEITTAAWPEAGEGTANSWGVTQTSPITEVYWFVVQSNDGILEELRLGPYPGHGANFADDSVPSIVDPVHALGRFGFLQPGEAPCPAQPSACCRPDGSCVLTTFESCNQFGGVFQGDGVACDPNPCPTSIGACCFDDGSCLITSEDSCGSQVGNYQGNGTVCEPNPCPAVPTTGACCVDCGEECIVTNAEECEPIGCYSGDWTTCDPWICGFPIPTEENSWGKIKARYREQR